MGRTKSYSTFPAFTLPLPLHVKLLNVVRVKPGRNKIEAEASEISSHSVVGLNMRQSQQGSSPADVLGQSLLAGMQLAAEGTLVLLLLKRGVVGVLAPVDAQIGLGGVALQADVALERLLSSVHSGVTLILGFEKYIRIYKCIYVRT